MSLKPFRFVLFALALLAVPAVAVAQPNPKPVAPVQNVDPAPVVPGQNGPPPVPAENNGPPPIPVAPVIEYFYVANGAAAGPVLIEALTGLVANATINGRTLVWYDGLANWIPADDLPELDEALANAVPAVPASEQYRLMMIGTWSATSTNNLGVTTTLEARYLSNGSFTGVVTLSGMGTVSAQPISGTWSVEVVSEGRFTLTTQPQNGTPSTAVLRVVNQNTLQNETDGYTARRVR